MKHKQYLITALLATGLVLSGCATPAPLDLSTYAPVIDVDRVDFQQYQKNLEACRILGQRAQEIYDAKAAAQRKKANTAIATGAILGALLGATVADDDAEGAAIGTIDGALLGSLIADDDNEANEIAQYGATIIVDNCLVQRGYSILSAQGVGGG